MTEDGAILVTGVAGYWGFRVAARLLDHPGRRVIGLDAEQPAREIDGLDFIQADVRNPLLAELLEVAGVSRVCHLAFAETARPSEGAFDLNVMGTAQVLRHCAQSGVRKVVLKSSTAVYGARPSNPAFLGEEHALRGSRRTGTTRDLVEIESFCDGFRHQQPDLLLTILRFASIVGPAADTPMTRFLKEPAAPSLLGFDPMMQLIHEDDVVEALVHAVFYDAPGAFNVAADDALPLNKIRGLAGKPPLAVLHPFAYRGAKWLRKAGLRMDRYLPIEPDYLRYPWVGDLARMRDDLGFAPRFTAEETLREFAEVHRAGRFREGSVSLAREEERLRAIIEQRRQAALVPTAREGGDDE
jgi:UDP-glucose 4-epimerase